MGLLIPIGQYVNLRPIRVFEGIDSPVRDARPGEVDIVVVRENAEGEYSEIGGRLNQGTPEELAVQEAVFTRAGVTRIADYAFSSAAGGISPPPPSPTASCTPCRSGTSGPPSTPESPDQEAAKTADSRPVSLTGCRRWRRPGRSPC